MKRSFCTTAYIGATGRLSPFQTKKQVVLPTQGDNRHAAPGYAPVQQLRFVACSCVGGLIPYQIQLWLLGESNNYFLPHILLAIIPFGLRGHLGVPDTVSEPPIVPLNYLVILHLIGLRGFQAHNFRN